MGLVHEFLLAPNNIYNQSLDFIYDFKKNNINNLVFLDDDLFGYIDDCSKWILTFDPIKQSRMNGFNYYGISFIDKLCASQFTSIMKAWADLFKCAPDDVVLTGHFSWIEGDAPADSGKYEKLYYKKQEVIKVFEELKELGENVISGDYFIVYFGI